MLAHGAGVAHCNSTAARFRPPHLRQQQRPRNGGQVHAGRDSKPGHCGRFPFVPIVAAAVTLVLFHRLLAYTTYFFPAFGRLIKGEDSVLVENSVINHHELRRASLSEAAMRAAVRGASNLEDLAQTQTVRLEHDGTISVVKKEE
jgi:hypothetical protein